MHAWLSMAVGENRQHGGNDGYDDEPSVHYSWDSTVPNHRNVNVGDAIVVWDKSALVGASIIQEIQAGSAQKSRHTCPHCNRAGIKARKGKHPRFKCYKCKAEFDNPKSRVDEITTYRSRHDEGWVDLTGLLSGAQLRKLCENPGDQLSIRRLRWDAFSTMVSEASGQPLTVLTGVSRQLAGGHQERMVRVRVGQSAFRSKLLSGYGHVCAFTGPAPAGALEAAHLYSYATVGVHLDQGGLLIRRDLHRLFDSGLIAVDPESCLVDVSPLLSSYPGYMTLQDRALHVEITSSQLKWLEDHWQLHRGAPTSATPAGAPGT